MTSTTLFSDVVLPAATWYEKHDLSTTDMHPFIHAFNPAITPPWQARPTSTPSTASRRSLSELAVAHLGVRKDLVAAPLLHDTAGRDGHARAASCGDWKTGDVEPSPACTMPKFVVVERDYPASPRRWRALGPLAGPSSACTTKGVTSTPARRSRPGAGNGTVRGGSPTDGRPLDTDMRRLRDDPRAVRHHQRPARHRGVPTARSGVPDRGWPTWRPSTRASRSRSPTCQSRPVPVITRPSGRAASTAAAATRLHHQRRAPQALAHPHRPPALLPRPRLDARARRATAGLPAAAGHAPALRRDRGSAAHRAAARASIACAT